MSQPYLGEIEAFAFNFAPKGWAFCNGQIMSIRQNTALFSLLGTTFGGDGVNTFALPNLQSRISNGWGPAVNAMGEMTGELVHTLLQTEVPAHNHTLNAAVVADPTQNTFAAGPTVGLASSTGYNPTGPVVSTMALYAADNAPGVGMGAQVIGPSNGGGQPHANTMPYLTINYCIALSGIFPSRS